MPPEKGGGLSERPFLPLFSSLISSTCTSTSIPNGIERGREGECTSYTDRAGGERYLEKEVRIHPKEKALLGRLKIGKIPLSCLFLEKEKREKIG